MQRILKIFYRSGPEAGSEPAAEPDTETQPNSRPVTTNHNDTNPTPSEVEIINQPPIPRQSKRPSALDFDLPPPTPQPAPPPTLEPAIFKSIFSSQPKKDYSHLSGLDLLRALLTDTQTVDRRSFNHLYIISTNNQIPLNKIIDRYVLSKLLWGPGKREINKSKSFSFGHLSLLNDLKDDYVEKKMICQIEFMNESCANLAIDILKYHLIQNFSKSQIEGGDTIEFECFNHTNTSDAWSWEEVTEKGMFEAEWLAMKKPKNFLFNGSQEKQWTRKVHFQPEQNLSPLSIPRFWETKLEINQFSDSLTLETILQTLLSFELLPKPLPNQIKFSKTYKKCQIVFPNTVPCKIAYLKIFNCLKEVKQKLVLEKLGSCTEVLIPDQSQLEHDDQWNVWDDAVNWDTDEILTCAQSIQQPSITQTPTITSTTSTRQSESYDPSSFKLPKKWQIQIVLATNLPIIQDPISSNLRSFLLTNVIRHPSSQGFFTLPFSVHLGSEGGTRFRTMLLMFYKPNSHQMKSKDDIKLQPDGEILRRQLKEVCHKFNSTDHLITYGKRKIKWQYLDLAYSSTDRSLQYELYKELKHSNTFKLMIHQLGPNGTVPNPSDDHRNDLHDDDQLRYGNLFAIPGGFKNLSRRHRARTNSNAATLLDDDDDDDVIPSDSESDSESEDQDSEEEEVGIHEGIQPKRVEKKDYRAIKEQLEDEILELECQKDEPEEGMKSTAFEMAQSVSDRRRMEIEERKRLKRGRRGRKKRRVTESDEESEESSEDEENEGEVDWEKRKRKMRKIRGMNDQEDETDSSGIITNPNFITNTEAIARRHARPLEREPGAVL